MKYIDLETYPRRSHYEFFKAMAYPYVGLTANVDVTNILAAVKSTVALRFWDICGWLPMLPILCRNSASGS